MPSYRIVHPRLERPVAVSQQDRDGVVAIAGHCQVQFSVFIEIPQGNTNGLLEDGIARPRAERAVSGVQQDRKSVGTAVGDRQVRFSVSVEVPYRDKVRGFEHRVAYGLVEDASTFAEQNHRTGGGIRRAHRQVRQSVSIEIRHG
jgi:hypothetical protein